MKTDGPNSAYVAKPRPSEPRDPLKIQVGGDHYKNFKIQPGIFSEENKLSFFQGDIVKRICRYNVEGGKGRLDLEKAKHEIDLLIKIHYDNVLEEIKKICPSFTGIDDPKTYTTTYDDGTSASKDEEEIYEYNRP